MNRMGTVEDNTKENVGGKKRKHFFSLKLRKASAFVWGVSTVARIQTHIINESDPKR